jgi:hypothetical protein
MLADYRLMRPMDRFYRKYVLTIQLIQKALDEMRIDEGLAISVFFLAWSDAISCRFESSRKHLNGFYRLVVNLDEQRTSSPTTPVYVLYGNWELGGLLGIEMVTRCEEWGLECVGHGFVKHGAWSLSMGI